MDAPIVRAHGRNTCQSSSAASRSISKDALTVDVRPSIRSVTPRQANGKGCNGGGEKDSADNVEVQAAGKAVKEQCQTQSMDFLKRGHLHGAVR